MIEILSKALQKTEAEIAKDINRPRYFDAQAAKDYGIIDKVKNWIKRGDWFTLELSDRSLMVSDAWLKLFSSINTFCVIPLMTVLCNDAKTTSKLQKDTP